MIEVALLWPTLRVFQSAEEPQKLRHGAARRVLLAAQDFCPLIAIDRSKRAGDPSKLVDHDPVWIRMNI
jgi:hypothetical protein